MKKQNTTQNWSADMPKTASNRSDKDTVESLVALATMIRCAVKEGNKRDALRYIGDLGQTMNRLVLQLTNAENQK